MSRLALITVEHRTTPSTDTQQHIHPRSHATTMMLYKRAFGDVVSPSSTSDLRTQPQKGNWSFHRASGKAEAILHRDRLRRLFIVGKGSSYITKTTQLIKFKPVTPKCLPDQQLRGPAYCMYSVVYAYATSEPHTRQPRIARLSP